MRFWGGTGVTHNCEILPALPGMHQRRLRKTNRQGHTGLRHGSLRSASLPGPVEAVPPQVAREFNQTRPTILQPASNGRSCSLVKDIPEPGGPSAPLMSPRRRGDHQDVRTLARSETIGHPHIGDAPQQVAQHHKLGIVIGIRVLPGRAAAAPPAHGNGGSCSV